MVFSRREIRSLVIQTLFEADFNGVSLDFSKYFSIFNRLATERNINLVDNSYAQTLLQGLISKYEDLGNIIEQVSLHYSLDKMGILDRNILRLGVFEILHGKEFEVPGKVAVNEAIEVSKLFLETPSRKFISGILGAVYKEVYGETEKDISIKKTRKKDYIGAFIYRTDEKSGDPMFAFIFDIFDRWTLSKTSLEAGEKEYDGVARVAREELNLTVKPIKSFGKQSYVAHDPEGPIQKNVTYYIAETKDTTISLKESGGLVKAGWFTYEESKQLRFYPDMKQIIYDTLEEIKEEYEKK